MPSSQNFSPLSHLLFFDWLLNQLPHFLLLSMIPAAVYSTYLLISHAKCLLSSTQNWKPFRCVHVPKGKSRACTIFKHTGSLLSCFEQWYYVSQNDMTWLSMYYNTHHSWCILNDQLEGGNWSTALYLHTADHLLPQRIHCPGMQPLLSCLIETGYSSYSLLNQ